MRRDLGVHSFGRRVFWKEGRLKEEKFMARVGGSLRSQTIIVCQETRPFYNQ